MELESFIKHFAEANEIENADALSAETEFRSLKEWSSLSIMMTIAFFDEEFGVEIGGTDIKKCTTISDLYELSRR